MSQDSERDLALHLLMSFRKKSLNEEPIMDHCMEWSHCLRTEQDPSLSSLSNTDLDQSQNQTKNCFVIPLFPRIINTYIQIFIEQTDSSKKTQPLVSCSLFILICSIVFNDVGFCHNFFSKSFSSKFAPKRICIHRQEYSNIDSQL